MHWIDWAIVGVVFLSVLISAVRGFIKEVLSLIIWVVGFILASIFYLKLAPLLEGFVATASLRAIVAWLLIFTGVLLAGALINYLINKLVQTTGLSGTDRLLGMLFGAARGLILVMIVVIFLPKALPVEQDNWWRQSLLIPYFSKYEEAAMEMGADIIDFFKQWF